MSNQSSVQALIRASTGTTGTWSEDWSALFDADAVAAGTWDERLLAWINSKLAASYTNINDAKQAYAVDQGFANWSSMDSITLAISGAATLAGDEPQIIVLDFTDDAFAGSGGHYGSAYIRNDSEAEIAAGAEASVLVLDFMDGTFVVDTGQYGSVYLRF